jgi:1-phosphatidylinositol phosphodiesterase
MEKLGSNQLISQLSIPGTHDSVTYVTSSANIYTKCQTLSLYDQLASGIRYLDIRLKVEDGTLVYAHGMFTYDETFDLALAYVVDFLTRHPSEFVIMSVKNEDDDSPEFQDLVEAYFANPTLHGRLWSGTALPTVGGVRGQIVPLRRYANYKTAGANPPGLDVSGVLWPKNTKNEHIENYLGEKFAIQDHYGHFGWTQLDSKWNEVEKFFQASRGSRELDRLYINFLSGTGGFAPAPSPGGVADSINARLKNYLVSAPGGRLGIVVMDYPTDAPEGLGDVNIRAIIQSNSPAR